MWNWQNFLSRQNDDEVRLVLIKLRITHLYIYIHMGL